MPSTKRSRPKRKVTKSNTCSTGNGFSRVMLVIVIAFGLFMVVQSVKSFQMLAVAEDFWAEVRSRDYHSAYQMLSDSFQDKYSKEQLSALMEGAAISEMSEMHWGGRSLFAKENVVKGVAKLGSRAYPSSTRFVKEDGKWKVSGFQFEGLQIMPDQTVLSKPSDAKAHDMVQKVSSEFLKAKRNGDFMNLYKMMPIILQARMTEDELKNKLMSGEVNDFSGASLKLIANELNENNELNLRGIYDSEPGVLVNYKFVSEKGEWRLVDMGFYVLAP